MGVFVPVVESLVIIVLSGPWTSRQWSFRKTGTMGMLASQADFGVWVQAPGGVLEVGAGAWRWVTPLLWGLGYPPPGKF